jgi:hypothetical protein
MTLWSGFCYIFIAFDLTEGKLHEYFGLCPLQAIDFLTGSQSGAAGG